MGGSVRVAVTGAQGVGKSTFALELCRLCRERLGEEAELFTNITGEVRASGLQLGRRATAETIHAFAAAHLRRQRTAGTRIAIFDRCLLDTLAYAALAGCLDQNSFARLEHITAKSMSAMDMVFYIGISSAYPTLDSLDEDLGTRLKIGTIIRQAAVRLGIPLINLDVCDPSHAEAGLMAIAGALG